MYTKQNDTPFILYMKRKTYCLLFIYIRFNYTIIIRFLS
ncbi:hypothetical protein M088_3553 [Bacteroides ovatus str. 3725 D1 iv]|nr:hypothetical protein M088_3553 [Bacteroides ovatus str. 3725 D1 iv]